MLINDKWKARVGKKKGVELTVWKFSRNVNVGCVHILHYYFTTIVRKVNVFLLQHGVEYLRYVLYVFCNVKSLKNV